MNGPRVFTAVKSMRVRVRAGLLAAVAALEDVVGVAGYALLLAGIYDQWGRPWTLMAAGLPLVVFYVWRSMRAASRGADR